MDVLLVRWILAWDVHALTSVPWDLFDANIFYPTKGSLALSEHLLGGMPLYAPFVLLGGSVFAYNAWLLSTFVLSGIFMHLLTRRWTGSEAAAYASGLAFAFAPWRWADGVGSPHLLQVQYFPLLLLSFDLVVARKRPLDGGIAGLVLGVQTLCSYYLGYQAFFIAGSVVLAFMLIEGVSVASSAIRGLALSIAVALVVILPPSLPYLAAAGRAELTPFGTNWSPEWTEIWRNTYLAFLPKMVGPATLALGVAAIPLAFLERKSSREQARRILSCTLLSILGVLLMRGPIPLVGSVPSIHWVFSKLVPGFEHLRAHNRFGFMVVLGCSVLIGFTVKWVAEKAWMQAHPLARRGVLGCMVVAILAPAALSTDRLQSFDALPVPRVHQWLAQHGGTGPVLEAGAPRWRKLRDTIAMSDSTVHWLPLLNGYTGHMPDQYELVAELAEMLPEPHALNWLADCRGVRWIIMHGQSEARSAAWDDLDRVREVASFPGRYGRDDLYEVAPRPEGSCSDTSADRRKALNEPLIGQVRIEALAKPWLARSEQPVRVTISNEGTVPLKVGGQSIVLRLAWLEGVNDKMIGRPISVPVPSDIEPRQELTMTVWATAPRRGGTYVIQAQLIQRSREDRTWVQIGASGTGRGDAPSKDLVGPVGHTQVVVD